MPTAASCPERQRDTHRSGRERRFHLKLQKEPRAVPEQTSATAGQPGARDSPITATTTRPPPQRQTPSVCGTCTHRAALAAPIPEGARTRSEPHGNTRTTKHQHDGHSRTQHARATRPMCHTDGFNLCWGQRDTSGPRTGHSLEEAEAPRLQLRRRSARARDSLRESPGACTAALFWGRVSRVLNSQRLTPRIHDPADRHLPASPPPLTAQQARAAKTTAQLPARGLRVPAERPYPLRLPPHCHSEWLNHPGRLRSPGCRPQPAGPVGPGKQDPAQQPGDLTPLSFTGKQTRRAYLKGQQASLHVPVGTSGWGRRAP